MPEQVTPGLPAEPKSDVLSRALHAGKWGTGIGAGLGALRATLKGKDYLKNTLGGAMLGGLGAGGFTAFHTADPFQRGGVAGTAYQKAMERALGEAVGGAPLSEAGSSALREALMSVLSGKGQFKPEQQQSLIQQFTQSVLPTKKGWDRRMKLASRVADQLSSGSPHTAQRSLKVMAQVMPDMDMRTAAQHALQRIESGRMRLPEERSALAALGERIRSRLPMYEKATPAISALSGMKEEFGSGKLSSEDFAKRIGLLTGRFGAQTEESQRMRQFLQQVIARPVDKAPAGSLMGRTMSEAPDVGAMVMSALER